MRAVGVLLRATRVPFQLSHKSILSPESRILTAPPFLLQHKSWVRMASLTPETPEWNAQRVRDTFLDYFKTKRDHTFGTVPRDGAHMTAH